MVDQTTTQSSLDGAPPPAGSLPSAAAAASPTPPRTISRPEGLPDQFWDDKEGVKLKDLLTEREQLAKVKADLDAAAASRPKTADEYKPELPKDFKLPEGWEIKTDDPLYKAAQKLAFEKGLSQEAFSALVALDAQQKIQHREWQLAEIKKRDAALGPHGTERVEALHKWVDSTAPDPKTAWQIKQAFVAPEQIAWLEKIQAALSSQGVVPFNGAHREGAPDPNAKPAGFEKWSPIDRRTYDLAKQRENSKAGATAARQ